MTEMFGEAWSPMSVPDLAPDDDDECQCGVRIIRCCECSLQMEPVFVKLYLKVGCLTQTRK